LICEDWVNHCPFHLIPLKESCTGCNKQIYGNQLSNNIPFCCTCGHSLISKPSTPVWERWGIQPVIQDPVVLNWIEAIGELSVSITTVDPIIVFAEDWFVFG
jgi:hypothetical protein